MAAHYPIVAAAIPRRVTDDDDPDAHMSLDEALQRAEVDEERFSFAAVRILEKEQQAVRALLLIAAKPPLPSSSSPGALRDARSAVQRFKRHVERFASATHFVHDTRVRRQAVLALVTFQAKLRHFGLEFARVRAKLAGAGCAGSDSNEGDDDDDDDDDDGGGGGGGGGVASVAARTGAVGAAAASRLNGTRDGDDDAAPSRTKKSRRRKVAGNGDADDPDLQRHHDVTEALQECKGILEQHIEQVDEASSTLVCRTRTNPCTRARENTRTQRRGLRGRCRRRGMRACVPRLLSVLHTKRPNPPPWCS
jgi:hypothetical protein